MRVDDIISKSDVKSKARSRNENLPCKFYKVNNNLVFYIVRSSHSTEKYIVTFNLLTLGSNPLRTLKRAMQGDLKIDCTCKGFLYQGWKYIAYKKNVGINKELRAPDIRNPNRIGLACKHIIKALEQFKKDYNVIYEAYKKAYKPITVSIDNPSVKDRKLLVANKSSKLPTQLDIDILNKAEQEYIALANEYNTYKRQRAKDDTLKTISFKDSDYYTGRHKPEDLMLFLSKGALELCKLYTLRKLLTTKDIMTAFSSHKYGVLSRVKSNINSLKKDIQNSLSEQLEGGI